MTTMRMTWMATMIALLTTLVCRSAGASPLPTALSVSADAAPASENLTVAKQAYLRWLQEGTASASDKVLIEEYLRARSTSVPHNPLDNSGGPDNYGYRYVDNSAPDTATFDWIELRGMSGTIWINDFTSPDDGTSTIPVGFNFPFYGGVYSNVTVCTNGFLEFATSNNDFTNGCLPDNTIDGPAILPFWDDLLLTSGGIPSGQDVVGYRPFGNYTVIEFDSAGYFSDNGSLKFEAILFADGRIKLQYNQFGGGGTTSNTVGIQADGSGPALQYRCDADGHLLYGGRAIWFWGPSGLTHDFVCSNVLTPSPGEVDPGQSFTVTAEITNFGTATESSPVKYRLTGGNIVSETTGALALGQIETHTFGTTLVMPTQPGRYLLKIWTDLASDENRANDTVTVSLHVGCADYAVTAPGTWSGNTCGEGNDCNTWPVTEVIYQVTIPHSGDFWTFTTCDENTNFDTYLILSTTCCGDSIIAFNDDNCSLSGQHIYNSTIPALELAAGTYYLDVEGFDGCGNYALTIELAPPCVRCQPGDLVEVVENPADTAFYRTDPDGGCNSDPNRFGSINFGQTVCGLGFFYQAGTFRDTDWYSFTVAQAESVTVHWSTDFYIQIGIVDYSDCNNVSFLVQDVSDEFCQDRYVVGYLPAGNYALFVAPFFGTPFVIADSLHYRATLYHGVAGADDQNPEIADHFALYSNYPNPFNPETQIRFALPHAADVTLSVYDITGRLVTQLAQGHYDAGEHSATFDGARLPSGIYFARLTAGEFNATQKMVLLK